MLPVHSRTAHRCRAAAFRGASAAACAGVAAAAALPECPAPPHSVLSVRHSHAARRTTQAKYSTIFGTRQGCILLSSRQTHRHRMGVPDKRICAPPSQHVPMRGIPQQDRCRLSPGSQLSQAKPPRPGRQPPMQHATSHAPSVVHAVRNFASHFLLCCAQYLEPPSIGLLGTLICAV
jgi:hypothetical protein